MAKRRGHGEGGISQRADGRWVARVDLGYVNGKRQVKAIYGKTRRDAAEKLRTFQQQRDAGLVAHIERQTVAQFLQRWLQDVIAPSKRPRTTDSYRQHVRTHLTPHIGRVALTQLSPQHVQRLIAILQAAGLNASTVQRVHSTLRSALATAVRWQLIPRNVAQVVTPPPAHEYEATALTVAQAKQFLSAIRGERNEALYLVTLMLGVRRGEVLALRWQDVDLEHGTLRVVGTLHTFKDAAALDDIVRTRSGLVVARLTPSAAIMQPKTKRSKRVLPLSPALITALHVHGLRQGSERARMGERWQEHGLVFPSSVGTPYNARNVIRMFERTVQAAGLPPLRFHDLRHSCASFLAASDPPTPPRVAMEILGHANIHTTLQIYTKALDQGTRAATIAMDALLQNEDVSA